MTASSLPAAPPLSGLQGRPSPRWRAALFAAWLVPVLWLAARHVLWRDEVRAFSLALAGDGLVGMARAVHGEGHPLLWYLLLRLAHMVVPVREVLPACGLVVGIAAAGLIAWRAPFRAGILAIVLFGGWIAYEYTVMARNYGIALLLMLAIADRAARRRDGPISTGVLLFLLCNTNVPAVILAFGFLLFRLVELLAGPRAERARGLLHLAIAAAAALAGVALCFLTVYPPFNEAAVSPLAAHLSPRVVAAAALNVGPAMQYLWPQPLWAVPGAAAIVALLVLAAPLSLVRSPAGLVAGLVVLPMLLLFFQLVYPGSYRHQALYLGFLVALHWMVASGRGGRWRTATPRHWPWRAATAAFVALLAVQLVTTASLVVQAASGRVEGQSATLGRLLGRPALRRAIVVADPDVMVEAVRYYAPNPLFLLRRGAFGDVTHLTRHADQHLTVGGILATARRLQAATGRPVVFLMQYPLDPGIVRRRWVEGTLGDVVARPGEVPAFLAATRHLAGPVALIRHGFFDERYDVYLLEAPVTAS